MALTFGTTDQAAVTHGVKVLVYGKAGVGKTTLCATAPAPIILSAESGLLALRRVRIPYIEIKNIQDLKDAFRWCTEAREASQFQTICLDSLSEIAEVILANSKQTVKDPRQAYQELMDRMMETVRGFRDAVGKHVYMSAKMASNKEEGTGVTMFGPAMPGNKVGPALPYLFDEVFHLGMGKTPEGADFRFLRTQPDFQYDAKDRSGMLDVLEQPNLTHVFNKILGG